MKDIKLLRGTDRSDRKTIQPEDYLVSLPRPIIRLNRTQKKYYKMMGEALIRTKKLHDVDLPLLNTWAVYFDRYVWAVERINDLGNDDGLIQTYESGAKNISTEVVLMDRAFDQLLKISRRFGLSIKDRKDMGDWVDAAQLNLFDEFVKEKVG